MNKSFLATLLVAVISTNAQANTVGLYLGGQNWQNEVSGTFGSKNTQVDFDLTKTQPNNFFVAIEHPWLSLPNIRVASTSLDTTGSINLVKKFSFSDEAFNAGDEVNASFDVSYIDYTLYYQLFDNGLFSFDLGLTARDFNGAITVVGPTVALTATVEEEHLGHSHTTTEITGYVTPTGKIKTNDLMPMLHIATNINLRPTSVSVFAQGDFLLIDNHSLYDYQAGLSYSLTHNRMITANVTLGYRAVKMEFKALASLYSNLDFKGTFVGVTTYF